MRISCVLRVVPRSLSLERLALLRYIERVVCATGTAAEFIVQ